MFRTKRDRPKPRSAYTLHQPTSSRVPSQHARPRMILVVEDHPDTQSAVAIHLSMHGFEVLVASDGETALQLVRERRPSLVYIDLCLPHISGYEVCERLRADAELRGIIILMTSAGGMVDKEAHSLEAGADMYLPKPFDLDELREHIERSLVLVQASPSSE